MDKNTFKYIGPGIVVAATGIGAGDMIAAAASGAQFGLAIVWAAIIGALFKYFLNEGIARWQLISGKTILEGWSQHFPGFVNWYFLIYLFIWSFVVGGALSAACGLAANAMVPALSVPTWGIIHALMAVAIVIYGKYKLLEQMMKFFIGIMFLVIIVTAFLSISDWFALWNSFASFDIPKGSSKFILGVIGGVGGSVTLLSYGYWIREKQWEGASYIKRSRVDLIVAYTLIGLFGIGIMIIAASLKPEVVKGSGMIIALSDQLEQFVGIGGKWIFLLGFWGAVFSSMIGVWQGVPYLFTDLNKNMKPNKSSVKSIAKLPASYFWFLLFIAIPPLVLLFTGKPVWIVIIYSVVGAFFMPFLAVLLLIMNNKLISDKRFKNKALSNIVLSLTLLLFILLLVKELVGIF